MTDPDANALLRAIVRHPDEDTPRLIYADWLEENGRAEEAEFLRVQCRLASAEPGDADYPELLDRDEELRLWLTAHVPGPRPTFPGGLAVEGGTHWWWNTHRGFPRFLEFSGIERPGTRAVRALAVGLERAFEVLPTRWLVVRDVTLAQLAALVKRPVLAKLWRLTVHIAASEAEADAAARLLAGCKHLRNLRGLAMAFSFGDAGAEALASAPWEGLEWFAPDSYRLTAAGVRALAGARWFRNLGELTLDDGLSDEAFETLSRLPPLPRLHSLDLSFAHCSAQSWARFARTRSLPALAQLKCLGDLSGGRMDALASADGFTLRALSLTGCGADPASAVAAAPWAGALRVLNLSTNAIGPAHAKAITGCKKFGALRHLNLANNALGPAALAALAANPALRGLRMLNLSAVPGRSRELTATHFDRFLARLDMPELRHLILSGRPVGSKAARRLADPKFASLTRLALRGCKLSDTAVKALIAAPALENLIQLDLSDNGLTTGVEALADRSVLPQLASCRLGENAIPPALERRLRRRAGVRA